MDNKRILTIQDVSCVGQCSLTVALPIISACGIETAILPSAVLSTHTAGFSNFTFRDLSDDMPSIFKHWQDEKIDFEGIYTGYLGSKKQIDYIIGIKDSLIKKGGKLIVDPAFADHGKLYPAFDSEYVNDMKRLVSVCDYCIPNISEACFLTGIEYKTEYDKENVLSLMKALCEIGAKSVILTGVGYEKGFTGVAVYEDGDYYYFEQPLLENSCHGTGDIYASAFVGAYFNGKTAKEASEIAAVYTAECIKATPSSHWYGACFESALIKLINLINA